MELSKLIINEKRWCLKHPSLWADSATLLYGGFVGYAETRGYHLGQYVLFLPIIPRIAYEALASYIRNTNRMADATQSTKSGNRIFIGSLVAGSAIGSSLAFLESIIGASISTNAFQS